MTHSYSSCLSVDRICLSVRLGREAPERATPQAVEVSLRLYFPETPKEALSDEGNFICYGKVADRLVQLCEGREFKLIEYLGMQLFGEVRAMVPPSVKIWMKARKCEVPVKEIREGASYIYTDVPPGSWLAPC